MSGALLDANGAIWSYNQSFLGYKNHYTDGPGSGVGQYAWADSGPSSGSGPVRHNNDLDSARLNAFAVETGRANIQFWGFNDTWGGENYGIPSGTYQPHVFTDGYLENSPVEWVSVTLSGNPTSISDHMYRGAGFNVTIYSIDWQRPRVSRAWVWGNPTGYQFGIQPISSTYHGNAGLTDNTQAAGCGLVGPTPNYWPNGLQTQPGIPQSQCLVGQEIDLGFYSNGTLISAAGDTLYHNNPSGPTAVITTCLFQNFTATFTQMCGGGWDAQALLPWNQTYVNYQGNANDAFFGTDLGRVGWIGGYTRGEHQVNTARAGQLFQDPFRPGSWSVIPGTTDALYETWGNGYPQLYGTAFPGAMYDLRGYTYGYIQDQSFQVYAAPGQVADMRINLVIGVNVTLDILFKKEHIITPTSANMSARVRLFNDQANLVAEWMSSEGTYVTASGFARAADGTSQYPFSQAPAIVVPKELNTYNFVPGGVTLLHVLMAGLPAVPPSGQNGGPQRYDRPKGNYFADPVVGSTIVCNPKAGGAGEFGIDCFGNPGRNWNNPGYFPNYGIVGASNYQGGWTAEVDFVNWYQNNTVDTVWTGPFAPNVGTSSGFALVSWGAQYYPPVAGLLMGESYHIIPGTTAKSGISLTEDLATKPLPAGVGMSMALNHLGPYSQQGIWQIANAHNSGEASAIYEVDLNGLVSGNALAFTWSNEFRPLSWGTITVTGAGLPSQGLNFYTYDGVYQAYLPTMRGTAAGGSATYKFVMNTPGYAPQTWNVAVSAGMSGSGNNRIWRKPTSQYQNSAPSSSQHSLH